MKCISCSLIVLVISLGSMELLSAQKSKNRAKEVAKYWKKEQKLAASTKHDEVARRYPEIGWLSGLWCKDRDPEPFRHYEVQGKWAVRLGTRGFTAEDNKQVFFPESFQMGEFLEKPVMVGNDRFFEFWSYSGDSKGLYGPVWWVNMERIEKVSDTEFQRVYAKSYTYREPTIDIHAFAQEESLKIRPLQHYKKPQVYRKCE